MIANVKIIVRNIIYRKSKIISHFREGKGEEESLWLF
jgi:hypothetical protein